VTERTVVRFLGEIRRRSFGVTSDVRSQAAGFPPAAHWVDPLRVEEWPVRRLEHNHIDTLHRFPLNRSVRRSSQRLGFFFGHPALWPELRWPSN
jgi:hypothetical protein